MKSQEEIVDSLMSMPELFIHYMNVKDYSRAKSIYDTARNVSVFVELDDETKKELFGDTTEDPPVEGLFAQRLVQKAYLEVSIKGQKKR